MPVLRARIGGAWVDVGGGADEVFVGPSDPIATAPATELWYDTDEPAVLTSDTRWNTAWGVVAAASNAGTVTTSGATESRFGVTTAFDAVAGRRYKITAEFTIYTTVVGDLFRFLIRRGATTAGTIVKVGPQYHQAASQAGYNMPMTVICQYDTPGATVGMQYCCCVARMSGTGTITLVDTATNGVQNTIIVEDIGPATGVVPVPDPAQPWTDVAASGFVVAQGSSTNIGKTSAYAAYNRVGRSIRWQGTCAYTGSGTAAGNISLTLPVAARAAGVTGTRPIGTGIFYDQSAGTFYKLVAILGGASTVLFYNTGGTIATFFGATEVTIAASDGLNWDVEYEAAS